MKFNSLKEACEWINKTGWLYKEDESKEKKQK